jgi:hypothetical protein
MLELYLKSQWKVEFLLRLEASVPLERDLAWAYALDTAIGAVLFCL